MSGEGIKAGIVPGIKAGIGHGVLADDGTLIPETQASALAATGIVMSHGWGFAGSSPMAGLWGDQPIADAGTGTITHDDPTVFEASPGATVADNTDLRMEVGAGATFEDDGETPFLYFLLCRLGTLASATRQILGKQSGSTYWQLGTAGTALRARMSSGVSSATTSLSLNPSGRYALIAAYFNRDPEAQEMGLAAIAEDQEVDTNVASIASVAAVSLGAVPFAFGAGVNNNTQPVTYIHAMRAEGEHANLTMAQVVAALEGYWGSLGL
jgi:hypothetical protein